MSERFRLIKKNDLLLVVDNDTVGSEIPEKELIERAKVDNRYFEPIYRKYYERIFRLILSRVQDVDISQDLTSNAFCKALVNLHKYKDQGLNFSSWLYRIALNICYDHFREKKKQRVVVMEDYMTENLVEEFQLEPDDLEEWMERLPEMLDGLKPADLELIELRFFESKSFRDIGFILNITENNAKTRTYRILKRIKKKFTHRVS